MGRITISFFFKSYSYLCKMQVLVVCGILKGPFLKIRTYLTKREMLNVTMTGYIKGKNIFFFHY